MYRAVPSEKGTATTIAMIAIMTVPAITAAIPKFPESGSQACVVKKPKPKS
jgi:hypothetical protein